MNITKNKFFSKFTDIFKDNNDYNEKTIVGFISFVVMIIFALVDIISGYLGKELVVNEFIYNSFFYITLGTFGIAEISKIFNRNKVNTENYTNEEREQSI